MKTLLAITGVIEAGTGAALAVAPSAMVQALLGAPFDSAASVVIGRILGAALFSLASACWFARHDALGRSAVGLVAAMLLYNIAAASLLAYARIGLEMPGTGLLSAATLHAGLAVWCIACLRTARAAK
jgi:hypothetical protein